MPLALIPIKALDDDVYQVDMVGTQGDRWWVQLDFTDDGTALDLTDMSAKLAVQNGTGSSVVSFDSTATPPTITVLGTQGSIVLTQDSLTTTALTPGTYTYDLELSEQSTLEFRAAGYVNIGDISEVNGVAGMTLSWWARTDVAGANYLFSKGGSSGLFVYADSTGDMTLQIDSGDYGVLSDYTDLINLGAWHHYAIVFDGTGANNAARCKLYVDGSVQTLVFTGTIPATTPALAGNDTFISVAAASWWGAVKDFRIYSAALSAANVAKLAAHQTYTTNMVHQYLLNEGSGTTANDTGSNPQDGTISATGPTWVTPVRTYLRGNFIVTGEVNT